MTNIIMKDLPVKLENLCQMTFSFEGLIKVIDIFHKNSLCISEEISNLNKRITNMENLKQSIEEVKSKNQFIEKSNDTINRNINNLNDRFLTMDNKLTDLYKRSEDGDKVIDQISKELNEHGNNINKLNRVVEENIKKSKELEANLKGEIEENNRIGEKVEEINKQNEEIIANINNNYNELNKRIDNIEKGQEPIISQFNDITEMMNNLKLNFERKNYDNDKSINSLISTLSSLKDQQAQLSRDFSLLPFQSKTSQNLKNPQSSQNSQNSPETFFPPPSSAQETGIIKATLSEVEKVRENLKEIRRELDIEKEYRKNTDERNKSAFIGINEELEKLKNLMEAIPEDKNENFDLDNISIPEMKENQSILKEAQNVKMSIKNRESGLKPEILSNYVTKFQLKNVTDTLAVISKTLSNKVNREDLDTNIKSLLIKIQKIDSNPFTKKLSTLKSISQSNIAADNKTQNSVSVFDLEFLTQHLEEKINEIVEGTAAEIIRKEIKGADLTQNKHFLELLRLSSKNSDDINKNYKSIIDIRSLIISSETQKNIENLTEKLKKAFEDIRANKTKIFELVKSIEGSEDEDDEIENKKFEGITIKERLNSIQKTLQNLTEKISKVEQRSCSISKEINDDIKQRLSKETAGVVEKFKVRLERFTEKFDSELKSKIDQIGLNSFENKMNRKIYGDLREKLDRKELRKNNNAINKKIDSLESKISRTLVDTIIDLKMDECPLLLRKSQKVGAEVCASCNQPVPKGVSVVYVSNSELAEGQKTKTLKFAGMNAIGKGKQQQGS